MSDTYYLEFADDPSKDGEVYKRYSSKNQPFKSIFIDVEVTELVLKSTHDQIVKGLEAENKRLRLLADESLTDAEKETLQQFLDHIRNHQINFNKGTGKVE